MYTTMLGCARAMRDMALENFRVAPSMALPFMRVEMFLVQQTVEMSLRAGLEQYGTEFKLSEHSISAMYRELRDWNYNLFPSEVDRYIEKYGDYLTEFEESGRYPSKIVITRQELQTHLDYACKIFLTVESFCTGNPSAITRALPQF